MWTSPEDARSDLFLSGAVHLFGGLILGLVVQLLFLDRIPGAGPVLTVLVPLVTTALVPVLLIRYRKEQLRRDYAFGGGPVAVLEGVVLAVPLALGGVLASVLAGGDPLDSLGALNQGGVDRLAGRVVFWVGFSFLLLYATVKARDAFPSFPQRLSDVLQQVGRYVAIAAVVALVLLQLAGVSWRVLLVLGGAAASVALGYVRYARGARTTGRTTVLVPVVLAAIGPFLITLRATAFLAGIFNAALFGGIGLLVVAIVEGGRRAEVVLGLGLGVALLSSLGGALA